MIIKAEPKRTLEFPWRASWDLWANPGVSSSNNCIWIVMLVIWRYWIPPCRSQKTQIYWQTSMYISKHCASGALIYICAWLCMCWNDYSVFCCRGNFWQNWTVISTHQVHLLLVKDYLPSYAKFYVYHHSSETSNKNNNRSLQFRIIGRSTTIQCCIGSHQSIARILDPGNSREN